MTTSTTTDRLRCALFATALVAAGAARAETIQANSTTLLLGRPDFRDGSTQTSVPLYELVNLVASDFKTPYANLEIALSSWGSLDLGDRRFWQNGALVEKRLTGDVDVAFVRGDFLDRKLSLRVGRQLVADGVARMVQLDGGEARVQLPYHFGLSAYAGSPVVPRFAARGGQLVTGDIRATFASGGRLSWQYASLLDVGTSFAIAKDRGEWSREDLGADFRLVPLEFLVVKGSSFWSLYESRLGEAILAATVTPARELEFTADYRHVEPDLFLPRNSILAVFAADKRNEVGAEAHWVPIRVLTLDGDFHALIEDAGTGERARVKGTSSYFGHDTAVGIELSVLHHPVDNGYQLVRLFASRAFRKLVSTLDLQGYFFERDVNGQRKSLTATGTVSYPFARSWQAAVVGTAGTTPYLSSQFEFMAKLVYQQTYAVREVR